MLQATDVGEQFCCTIESGDWQKLFRNTYGFFDQKRTVCPPISCVRLVLPRNGPARATIIAGPVRRGDPLSSKLEVTVSSSQQCPSGQLSPAPNKAKKGGRGG